MRAVLISVVLSFAGCQCARVPEDVCLVGECEDGGSNTGGGGGVATGGGFEPGGGGNATGGGVGGGTTTGGGTGTTGGGSPFCEDWECVNRGLPPVSPPPASWKKSTLTLPPGLTSACEQRFLGGVKLINGEVLLIPHCASHFVFVTQNATATQLGPRKIASTQFNGGALDCNGNVAAFPLDGELSLVTPTGALLVVPNSAGSSAGGGGVFSGSCANPRYTFTTGFDLVITDPEGNGSTILWPSAWSQGRVEGCARTPRETVCFTTDASEHDDGGVHPLVHGAFADDGSFTRYADEFDSRGAVIARNEAIITIEKNTGLMLFTPRVGPQTRVGSTNATEGGLSWPASRGDGYVYVMNHEGLWWGRDDASAGLTLSPVSGYSTMTDPFAGLVLLGDGTIIGVPGTAADVLILQPMDGGVVVPPSVSLSPFFNKL